VGTQTQLSGRAGVTMEFDREMAIEQRHRQFGVVMEQILTIGDDFDLSSLDSTTLQEYLEANMEKVKKEK